MKQISRRSALLSAAIIPAAAISKHTHAAETDRVLVALGHRFDVLATQLDHAIEHGLDTDWNALYEFGEINDEICATAATTIEGLCVKARAVCWALLGDLEYCEPSPVNERMGLSIVRDLIRLHRPDLEHPGALTRLVKEIEENAKPPSWKPDNDFASGSEQDSV